VNSDGTRFEHVSLDIIERGWLVKYGDGHRVVEEDRRSGGGGLDAGAMATMLQSNLALFHRRHRTFAASLSSI
jgi:hypothetical protein